MRGILREQGVSLAVGARVALKRVAQIVHERSAEVAHGTFELLGELLEEVRAAPLDDASRNRLREIHATSIHELEDGLAPELREELDRLTLPFTEGTTPSDAELRIVVLVELDEGIRFVSNLLGVNDADVQNGMEVALSIEDVDGVVLPQFRSVM